MTKHTPGPWVQTGRGFRIFDAAPGTDGGLIAEVAEFRGMPEESLANARLVAAAPELLNALKTAAALLEKAYVGTPPSMMTNLVDKEIQKCDELIAKIEGATHA